MSKASLEKKLSEKRIDWADISRNEKLTENFMREHAKKIKWDSICSYQKLSESFIEEFIDKINWYEISIWQILSEDFMRKYQDKIDWREISKYQKLSNDFICEFKDKVDWNYICAFQKLSNECMRTCKDYLFWENVYIYQEFDQNFKEEFKDKLPQTSYIPRLCAFYPKSIEEMFSIIKEHIIKQKGCKGKFIFNQHYLSFYYRFNPEYAGNPFIDLSINYYDNLLTINSKKNWEVKGGTNRTLSTFNIPLSKIDKLEEKVVVFLENNKLN